MKSRSVLIRTLPLLTLPCMVWGSRLPGLEPDGLFLTVNGHTNCKIIVPNDASDGDKKAAAQLQKYLKRISGADFPIISDSGKSDTCIWIGSAPGPAKFPVAIDWRKLEEDGFTLQTRGSLLIIAGGSQKGSLYGVNSFLEKYLGCRKYSPTVESVPNIANIRIGPINDTQVPRIKFRMENFYEPEFAEWHKLDTHKDEWGLFVHTFRQLVPPEKYFKEHPEYFTLAKSGRVPDAQLCLSNPVVFRIVVDGLKERMRQNPKARYWSVSQNDTYSPCECDSCRLLDSLEGSPSGSILSFVNRVADEFPDKIISTLAYQFSRSAPLHVKPRKNVNIMLCSIECNRSKPLEADPTSASFVKDVRDWSKLTNNILLWDYVIQFRNLVSPFPNFRILQPNIQFFAKNGISSVFEQGLGSMQGEFAELRTYLIAKLLWNPDLNIDSVTTDFLRGYYGKAAPYIQRYIDRMHDKLGRSGEDLLIYGYPLPSKNGYLSVSSIDAYGALFDRAENAVLRNPAVHARVQVARLPLQFAILEQAKIIGTGERGFFRKTRRGDWEVRRSMIALLDTFVVRCQRAGIERLEESGTSPEEYRTATKKLLRTSMQKHLALFKKVSVKIPASPRYHNGDESALTDGLRGWEDYHMNWVGFEGEDMIATIDLGTVMAMHRITVDFLQDINSWIFLPLQVEFSVSENGTDFRPLRILKNNIEQNKAGAFITPFAIDFEPLKGRYIRVDASTMDTCPNWHKGAGGLAWIFADEIIVE